MTVIHRAIAMVAALLLATAASADWYPDPDDTAQLAAAEAVAAFRRELPRSGPYFDGAYGYAILPTVTRAGLGFGAAYGSGMVIEGDSLIGGTRFWQFTSGIQAGAKVFSMIVFFKDREALEYFTRQELQFKGQAGIALANWGIAGTPAYNDGVAIMTLAKFGLMGEFTVSGARYTYQPRVE